MFPPGRLLRTSSLGLPLVWTLAAGSLACQKPASAPEAPPSGAAAGSSPSAPVSAAPAGLPDRDPALARRLVEQQGALLLDVRTEAEWNQGHLERAEHLPVDELPQRLSEVAAWTGGDQQKPIVVYCRSGARAARAKQILLQAGYPNVTNLGGVQDWPAGN